jgi:two-component system phosphate regulon response regulator PhoB
MYRVLVVEDNADINATLQEALRLAGYEVVGVLDGESALLEVRQRRPHLVLLDQMLPDIDGLEICRKLRSEVATLRLPIIFLTARASVDARIKGLSSGADDYVVKPFSMEELLLRIGALLRRAGPLPEAQIAPAWLLCREQFRIWDSYAKIHLDHGEWQECLELCRSILGRCQHALNAPERRVLYLRLAECAQRLGDRAAELDWRERADEESRAT